MIYVRKNNDFEIPQAILSQVGECSAGGYMLFTFDLEGNPIINSNFDSQHQATAMHSHVKNWCLALENLNLQITTNNIIQQNSPQRRRKK